MGEAFTHRSGGCALTSTGTKGEGEARSPLVRGSSHGAGRLKNGRFAALAVKAVFLTDGQAIACLPIGEICGPS